MSPDDRETLRRAAAIIARPERRDPWDRCACGHLRSDHLGQGVGCVGGCGSCHDECKRFKLDADDPRSHANALVAAILERAS